MRVLTILAILLLLVLAGFAYYHYCIDTLALSELVNKPTHPAAALMVTLLDFDTGITRWEVIRLKSKIKRWQQEEARISLIHDQERRTAELERLTADMLRDSTVNKIVKKVLGERRKGLQGLLRELDDLMAG